MQLGGSGTLWAHKLLSPSLPGAPEGQSEIQLFGFWAALGCFCRAWECNWRGWATSGPTNCLFLIFFFHGGMQAQLVGVISNAIEGVGHCRAPLVSLNKCNLGDAGQQAPSDCIRPAYGSGRPAIRAPEDASALRVQSKRSRPLQLGG